MTTTQDPELHTTGQPVPKPSGMQPDLSPITGTHMRLEALDARHIDDLFTSFDGKPEMSWTFMPYGPFASRDEFAAWFATRQVMRDPWFYAYVDQGTGRARGMGSFMRSDPNNGVIEIGNIWFSPAMQKSREATECIYLMLRYGFEVLGVRRLEWKCDSRNAPSRAAALRFGFSFEGIFRQHMIIKGLNRDTAWFAMMDHEWPRIKATMQAWLADGNFDANGAQKARLQAK